MYMKLKDGKSKVLTLSYDDGVVQDIRLVGILNKYGIKATFNVNSGMYIPEDKVREQFRGRMKLSEAQALYINSGHEVAVHGLNHPRLEQLSTPEILTEVLEDRNNLENQFGGIIRGMAYPYGTYNDSTVQALGMCGICYSRTVKTTESLSLPQNWLIWDPTCHHNNPKLMDLAAKFADTQPRHKRDNWLFYLWGHSYEFDDADNWHVIEEFAAFMGGRDEIWYATNIEIYDYVKAYEALQVSVDKKTVYNPTATDVWFWEKGQAYCVHGGQTIIL